MRTATFFVATALLVFVSQVRAEERKDSATDRGDNSSLLGNYKVVKFEKDGKEESAANLKNMKVEISRMAITWWRNDTEKPWLAYYQVTSNPKPCHLQMTLAEGTNAGKTVMGIVEREGDQVRLCWSKPGEQAPNNFTAADTHVRLTLERIQANNRPGQGK